MRLEFVVYGVPQPQGSARAFMPKGARFPVVTSDNPNLKEWRNLVAMSAQPVAAAHGLIAAAPVNVEIEFRLPRPKSLSKRLDTPHMSRPDLDKLVRAVFDALTGVIFSDDGQVVSIDASKRYARVDESPGCLVVVMTQEAQGALLEPPPVALTSAGKRHATSTELF